MITSFEFSQRFTTQSILFDACRLTIAGIRILAAVVGRTFAVLSHLLHFLAAIEPYVLGAFVGFGYGLIMFAVVASIPPTFWLGLLIVGAFGRATFPRSKGTVRNG